MDGHRIGSPFERASGASTGVASSHPPAMSSGNKSLAGDQSRSLEEIALLHADLSLGMTLRTERELRQVSLEEVAQNTRIPLKMLRHLEADEFESLPGDVFTRGFLRSYSKSLDLPAETIVQRFDAEREAEAERHGEPKEGGPAPIGAVAGPERSRRFGIAIAVVVLLILFTLALSIVLRPRHRDTPVELSLNAPALDVSTSDGAASS